MGVKDEVELVRTSINHLRSIGVDSIFVFDDGSTDGTLEVLNELKTRDDLWVVNVNLDLSKPEAIQTQGLTFARKAHADWVLFLDADEFWIPATGSLKDCLSLADSDILNVDRFNVPLTERGPLLPDDLSPSHYQDLYLCVGTIPNFHIYREQHPEVPFILGAPLGPKVMARPGAIRAVTPGGHTVEPLREGLERRARPLDLIIAHVPFSSFGRFERKVMNISQLIRVMPDFFSKYNVWHWQEWASQLKEGRLREEFERQLLDEQLLADLIQSGSIRSASEMFRERGCSRVATAREETHNRLH
jgi:glycosyltransferase involved in cell wall biosynthesis